MAVTETRTGTCRRWVNTFGFIVPDGGGNELFAHFSAIQGMVGYRELLSGDRVEFTTHERDGRTEINWCRLIED